MPTDGWRSATKQAACPEKTTARRPAVTLATVELRQPGEFSTGSPGHGHDLVSPSRDSGAVPNSGSWKTRNPGKRRSAAAGLRRACLSAAARRSPRWRAGGRARLRRLKATPAARAPSLLHLRNLLSRTPRADRPAMAHDLRAFASPRTARVAGRPQLRQRRAVLDEDRVSLARPARALRPLEDYLAIVRFACALEWLKQAA